MSASWKVVEGALNDLGQWIEDQQAMPDDGWIEVRDRALAEIARLREREAQLGREVQHAQDDAVERYNACRRAEARVEEAERELQKVQAFSTVQAQFIIDFQARVKELEEALRKIADARLGDKIGDLARIARRALGEE